MFKRLHQANEKFQKFLKAKDAAKTASYDVLYSYVYPEDGSEPVVSVKTIEREQPADKKS